MKQAAYQRGNTKRIQTKFNFISYCIHFHVQCKEKGLILFMVCNSWMDVAHTE